MNETNKCEYYVIGGQYVFHAYGSAPTLLGAKRLAAKNVEYWDNWQGWHVPAIYRAEDVREVVNFYGEDFAPREGACPVAVARYVNGRAVWEEDDA